MAKRFIGTDLWTKTWFQELPLKMKLLWILLFTNCNHAGIIEPNYKLLSFLLGVKVTADEIGHYFPSQIVEVDNGDKWFLVKFIKFQYGTLNPKVKAHASVIKILDSYKIDLSAIEGLAKGFNTLKDKDKDKDIDKYKVIPVVDINSEFEKFWNAYDKKVGKANALIQWKKIDPEVYPTIFQHVQKLTMSIDKQFRKDPERYLRYKCWNDEVVTESSTGNDIMASLRRKYND